jgi:carboxyl-terminal processing protease
MPRHKSFCSSLAVAIVVIAFLGIPRFTTGADDQTAAYNLSRMEGFSWVLLQLKDDYVDPTRVKPTAMMKAALEFVERRAYEVEIKLAKGNASVQVGGERRAFEVGQPATVWEMNYNLQPVFEFIGEHLESASDPKEVEFAAINGMLTTLDPHSNLLPPELFREMQLKTTGEFGGLGIRITIRSGALTIISPLPDTPAARMGLRALDQIVRIGDQSTVNMPLDEAVSLLRAKPGTKVTIWVMRQGWSEPHKYVITRGTIRVKSVVSELLDNRIGYIQIQDFGRHTAGDLLRHLTDLKRKAKGLKGLILDLRNNAGGLMKAAVQVADLFLDRGIIVATVAYSEDSTAEQRVQKSREEQRAKEDGVEHDLPLVVLVNSGSASASEILAGAMKNLDRAVLMGEQTFGKGTVQILNERVPRSVQGACLKLTVAEYLIPGDISIQEVGVTPDIQLTPVVLNQDTVQAFAQQDRFREADIPAHLKTHKAFELKPAEVVRYVFDEEKKPAGQGPDEEPPLEEPGFKEDFEIKMAKEFLLKANSPKGSTMLDKGIAFLREVQQREQRKIEKKMTKLGIDWSGSSAGGAAGETGFKVGTQPGMHAEAEFSLTGEGAGKDGRALADKKVSMKLQVHNKGNKPYFRLRAESESKYSLFNKREFLFGRVNPGETKTWELPIKIPRSVVNRADEVRFKFFSEGGSPPPPLETTITTSKVSRPAFGFSWQIQDSEGNDDGLIQPGEKIKLEVKVHNQGEGKAYRAKAMLKNDAGKDLFLEAGKGRVEMKEILPGHSKDCAFAFRVRQDTTRDTLPVELTIWDADLGTTQTAKLELPIHRKTESQPVKSKVGLEVKKHRAEVRSGGDVGAPLIAFAKKGSVFLGDRRRGKWYRIKGKTQSAGWIHAGSVKVVPARRARPAVPSAFLPFVQLTPPKILLEEPDALLMPGPIFTLKGKIEDADQKLRDVAVWVGDDKVFLQSGESSENPHELKLNVPIKLDPGPNAITVVAREGPKYSVQHTLVITRPGGLDWKKDDAELADGRDTSLIME